MPAPGASPETRATPGTRPTSTSTATRAEASRSTSSASGGAATRATSRSTTCWSRRRRRSPARRTGSATTATPARMTCAAWATSASTASTRIPATMASPARGATSAPPASAPAPTPARAARSAISARGRARCPPPRRWSTLSTSIEYKAHIAYLSELRPPDQRNPALERAGKRGGRGLRRGGARILRHTASCVTSTPTQSTTKENVYATKVGTTNPDEMYIVSAHIDSYNHGQRSRCLRAGRRRRRLGNRAGPRGGAGLRGPVREHPALDPLHHLEQRGDRAQRGRGVRQ